MWLTPHTGRRHQLRLHMAHVGHPIVGDYTYAADKLAYRMFLHAASLELPLAELRAPEQGPLRMESPAASNPNPNPRLGPQLTRTLTLG